MIKIEPCKGCGRTLLQYRIANLVVKCEPVPLASVGEIVALLATPNPPGLWMVENNQQGQPTRLRGARSGELSPVPEHRCTRVGGENLPAGPPRPVAAPQEAARLSEAESVVGGPARPGDASTAPFSRSSRNRADPACDGCGKPLADGTYASIEVGDLMVWAHHVLSCEGR